MKKITNCLIIIFNNYKSIIGKLSRSQRLWWKRRKSIRKIKKKMATFWSTRHKFQITL